MVATRGAALGEVGVEVDGDDATVGAVVPPRRPLGPGRLVQPDAGAGVPAPQRSHRVGVVREQEVLDRVLGPVRATGPVLGGGRVDPVGVRALACSPLLRGRGRSRHTRVCGSRRTCLPGGDRVRADSAVQAAPHPQDHHGRQAEPQPGAGVADQPGQENAEDQGAVPVGAIVGAVWRGVRRLGPVLASWSDVRRSGCGPHGRLCRWVDVSPP